LGIDPIPLKTCNWNCVYCQLGRSVPLTSRRREYVPAQDVLADVEGALASRAEAGIDWVTFVGSGEPTLNSRLGEMIRGVKRLTQIPVAVITNGSLLYRSEVRAALSAADAVLPSLDAGNPTLYRRINRPHPAATFERLIEGLRTFRRQFSGKLWVEVMLIQDLNDGEQELSEIADTLRQIQPDEVHINLPTRPPCETWVRPASPESLSRAVSALGAAAIVVHPVVGKFEKGSREDIVEAVVDIITRHPVSQAELEAVLAEWTPGDLKRTLAALQESGKAQTVERYGRIFWTARASHFPPEAHSVRTEPRRPRVIASHRGNGGSDLSGQG